MSMFGKKICLGCGRQIGLLDSAVKMCGGSLCNICYGKFSPYLNRSKLFDQNQIRAYLRYRENNLSELSAFKATRSFGEFDAIFVDEQKQKFYIKNLNSGVSLNGSDVIDFSSITDCRTKVNEKKEVTQSYNTIDKIVSMVKPSYTFTFDYYFIISLNHPWIDNIKIKLNKNPIQVRVTAKIGEDPINPRLQNPDCISLERTSEEIKNILLTKPSTKEEKKLAIKTQSEVVAKCPYCGAPIKGIKDTTAQCSYCGGYCSF